MFLYPNNFFQFDLRNLQEQVKKAFCYQKLFWPFTVWISFASFSRSLVQFFLTVGQNDFGNKIPFLFWKKNQYICRYSKILHCSPSYEVDIRRCPFSLKKKKVWALAELVNWVSFLTSRLTAPLSKLSLIFRPFFQNGTTFRQARFCCGIASRCTHKLN